MSVNLNYVRDALHGILDYYSATIEIMHSSDGAEIVLCSEDGGVISLNKEEKDG